VAVALAAGDTLGWEGVFLRAAPNARLPWEARVPHWVEMEWALAGLMDQIIRGGADPEAAAHEMALQLDHLLGVAR
jgi:hypothetical protein